MKPRDKDQKMTTIGATGKGVVSTPPEVAILRLGVITEAKKPGTAAKENAARMSAVIAAIKKQGVPETEIQTVGLELGPRYRWDPEENEDILVAYRAENSVRVRVKVERVGDVYDAGVEAGANSGGDIAYAPKDEREDRLEALRQATKHAVEEIEAIAEALGVTLDRPISAVTELPGERDEDPGVFEVGAAMAKPTPILPGSVDTRATVRVVYGVEAKDA